MNQQFTQTELQRAVKSLGGIRACGRVLGEDEATVRYWLKHGAPRWRLRDVQRLLRAADKKVGKHGAAAD